MAATGVKAPNQPGSLADTSLADTSSVLVVKRTFFELVDHEEKPPMATLGRRVCSDPGLFESCEQEQLRYAAARDDGVEFDITGLSDTETNPGELVQATSVDAGTTDPSEHGSDEPSSLLAYAHASAAARAAGSSAGGASLPEDLQLVPEKESALSRLVSENARLALENKLLKENARLAAENKLLTQGMSEGNMAFASWWRQQCVTQEDEEVEAMPVPSPAVAAQSRDHGSKVWGSQAAATRRQNYPEQQRPWTQQPSLRLAGERAKAAQSAGLDVRIAPDEERTTIMLRNLPNNYSRAMVLAMLNDEGFSGKYNFLYLPIDFKSRACLGYAFVNLINAEATAAMWNTFNGYSKWMLPSKKICSVSWSGPHQGLAAHVERYRNSPVMHPSVPDEYKPVVFDDGVRIVFPAPTKTPRAPRVRNHRDQAGQ